jgi:hypothetical protein
LFGIKFYLFISREYFLVRCLNSDNILLMFRQANLQIQDTRLQFGDGFCPCLPTPFLLRLRRPIPFAAAHPPCKSRARNQNVTEQVWRILPDAMLIPQLAEIALAERPELLSLTSAQMADTNARYNVLIQQANLNYETASSVNPHRKHGHSDDGAITECTRSAGVFQRLCRNLQHPLNRQPRPLQNLGW